MFNILVIIIYLIGFVALPLWYIWHRQNRVFSVPLDTKRASVMLIVKDGLILTTSRRNNKDKFCLPGGKVECDETLVEAAIRETLEEVGIKVIECQFVFVENDSDSHSSEQYKTYCYYATQWEETSSPPEGTIRWLTVEDLFSEISAFPNYYKGLFEVFREHFPEVYLR